MSGPKLTDEERAELEEKHEQDTADGNPDAFDPDDDLNDCSETRTRLSMGWIR